MAETKASKTIPKTIDTQIIYKNWEMCTQHAVAKMRLSGEKGHQLYHYDGR